MPKLYPALFLPEETGYSVIFPDLPGCQTQGETDAEAAEMAQEALGLYLAEQEEDRMEVPPPSALGAIQPPDGAFVVVVSANVAAYRRKDKAVKKTLTIPAWLNRQAEQANAPFSQILQQGLKEYLNVQ